MSVFVVYKPHGENARIVEEYLHDFTSQTSRELEVIDPDSRRGADFCRLYEVVEYPTVVATAVDGQLSNIWPGLPLPTIEEVSYYVQ